MIPKRGNRFSDKIMLNQKDKSDSTQLNQTLASVVKLRGFVLLLKKTSPNINLKN
jgi:hypothetical protein